MGVLYHNMESHTEAVNTVEPLAVRRDHKVRAEVDTGLLVDYSRQAGEVDVAAFVFHPHEVLTACMEEQRVLQLVVVVLSIRENFRLGRLRYCSWPADKHTHSTVLNMTIFQVNLG